MFEIITVFIFTWLMIKAAGLAFRLTWGVAKILAGILMGLALPLLIVCVFFIGGLALILPVALIVVAIGILEACT